jgi:hypothetical protein
MKNLTNYIETLLDGIPNVSVIMDDNKLTIIKEIDYLNNPAYAAHIAWDYRKRCDEVYKIMNLYGFNQGDFNYKEKGINLPEGWKLRN